jgi:plastocyanin
MRTRPAIVAATALAALTLAACGDEEREGSFTSESGTGTSTTGGTGTDTTGTGTTGTGPAAAPNQGPAKRFQISETEFKLRPTAFALGQTGTVVFVVRNEGQVAHALEVEGPTGEFETEEIAPGGKATLKADVSKSGAYKLYCPIGNHEDQGMVGQLLVAVPAESSPSADHADPDRGDDTGGTESGGDDDSGGTPAPY